MTQGTYLYKGVHNVVKSVLAGHMDIFKPSSKVIKVNTSGTKIFRTG